MAETPLKLLRRQVDNSKKSMLPILLRARRRIEARIGAAANKRRLSVDKQVREKLYREIVSIYDRMDVEIDDWALELIEKGTASWHAKAKKDMGKTFAASIVGFSRQHVRDYFQLIHPDNAERLAAVRTKAMRAQDIRILRESVIDASREASLLGLTGVQLQKRTQELTQLRFIQIANEGTPSWQFIDRAGRRWKTGNYFNMLTRTLTREVANQSYIDTLLKDGEDLASIEGGAEPCPICARWRGLIISLSGTDDRFPSYADAREAGVFHPNCVCQIVHVDADLEAEQVEAQSNIPNPTEPTPKEWNAYANQIQDAAKDKEGVFAQRQAVKIDKSLNLTLEEANIMNDAKARQAATGIFL